MTSPQPATVLNSPGGIGATVKVPSLRSTFAWTLLGNCVYAACQWGMIAALAKLGSTSAVGRLALAFAITAPIFMLTNLFLRGIQATDVRSEFRFQDYFTLRALGTAAGLLVVVVTVFLTKLDSNARVIIVLVGLAKAVESFTDVIAGLLQKHERLDQVAISMMWKGAISLVVFVALYSLSHNVAVACSGLVLSWLAVFAVYDLRLATKNLSPGDCFWSLDRPVLLRLAKLAAPVGIVMGLSTLNVNVPRYILERFRGSSELGVFAALGYSVVALGLIVNALGQSAVVRMAHSFAEGRKQEYTRLIGQMSVLGLAASAAALLIGMIAGRRILQAVYGPEYAKALNLLLLFIATAGVTAVASFLSYGMTAARRFRDQVPVFAVTLAATALTAWLLVPHWGMYGAAIALLVSAATQACGAFIVVHYALKNAGGSTAVTAENNLLLESESMVPGFEPAE